MDVFRSVFKRKSSEYKLSIVTNHLLIPKTILLTIKLFQLNAKEIAATHLF